MAATRESPVVKVSSALRTWIWFPKAYIERYDVAWLEGERDNTSTSPSKTSPASLARETSNRNHLEKPSSWRSSG